MQEPSSIWSKDFAKICLSSFFVYLTFYALAATLPIFVLENLQGSQQQVGLTMTVFIIAAVIVRPLAGQWFDRMRNRKIVFVSLFLFLLSTTLYLGSTSLFFLLALRVLHGSSFGLATTVTGAVAVNLVPEQRKGEGIGYFSMFMSMAMVIGPFFGLTIASQFSFTVLFLLLGVIALFSFLCGTTVTLPKNEPDAEGKVYISLNWKDLIEPKAVPISLAVFVLAFAYSGITTFISVYAKELSLGNLASYFFICFGIMIVLPRPFIGKLFDRCGEDILAYPGILLFVLGMIGLSQAQTPALFLASGAIAGLGYGALIPCFQTLAIQASPLHRRGLATSTYALLFDLGYGLGCYFLGIIAEHTNYHTMYLVSSAIVALTAVFYYVFHQKKRNKVTHETRSG